MARLWAGSCVVVVAAALVFLACLVHDAQAESDCDARRNGLLAHWSFDGTWVDVSQNQRGDAIASWDRPPVGGNINLQWAGEDPCAAYVHIGNPGYLEVPRVDIHNISFTVSFSLRLNGKMNLERILYGDWSTKQWTFISWVTPERKLMVTLRNTALDYIVTVTSSVTVPMSQWIDIAFNWDRAYRTATLFINGAKVATQKVAASVNDINLFKSNTYYYQFGVQADVTGANYDPVEADVRNLRVFKGLVLATAAAEQPEVVHRPVDIIIRSDADGRKEA